MKSERTTLVGALTLASALASALALAPIVFAQENPAPSGPMPMGGAATSTTPPSDSSLMLKVKVALASDPQMKGATIDVAAANGTVTLSGRVDSKATAEHAQQVVAQIDGVKSVDNELKTKSD